MERYKNHQTSQEVARLVKHALGADMKACAPLTAGQCNALYAVTLSDGSRCVLKVGALEMRGLRRGERWLMQDVYTRQYADDRQYRWGRDLFAKAWAALKTDRPL